MAQQMHAVRSVWVLVSGYLIWHVAESLMSRLSG